MGRSVPRGGQLRAALQSVVVGSLLLLVVSTIAGAEGALFFTVLAAWLLFPLVMGLRNTLDAACVFMLVSLGVVVVVWIARHGLLHP